MTDEMIKAITDAEARAVAIKNEANEKAEALLLDAQAQVVSLKSSSEEVLKAYKDTQLAAAKNQAELAFNEEIAKSKKEAQAYASNVIKNADTAVIDIVGRVISANR